jgi:hypothetical protein
MDRARVAMFVVPLAAMATLAAGLRVGASDAVVGAVVYAAPLPSDPRALVWQVATLSDDHGVKEMRAIGDLSVVATRGNDRAEWRGASNSDGIAEARVPLPLVRDGDAIRLEIRAAGVTLAEGRVAAPRAWGDVVRPTFARPTKREGAVMLDVAPVGGRLAVGFPGSMWVRATDRAGHALADVTLDVEPEPGLELAAPRVVTCASGWAEIVASPMFHIIGMSVHAKAADAEGLWYGGIPVAGGASHVAAPPRIAPNEARMLDVFAAGTRGHVYAELDDARGRVVAQVLEAPQGAFELPPLTPGLYWLVTSSEASGAESLTGASLAQPLLVEAEGRPACEVGAMLATSTAAGFPRTVVLDGFVGRREHDRERHRLGATIGLSALVLAATLETLLLLRAARSGAQLSRELTRRAPAGSIAIALLAGLLGFALLAALLLYRGT